MARTKRRRWLDADWTWHYDKAGRDRKGQCWCCSGWLRQDRRRRRHQGKAQLGRESREA